MALDVAALLLGALHMSAIDITLFCARRPCGTGSVGLKVAAVMTATVAKDGSADVVPTRRRLPGEEVLSLKTGTLAERLIEDMRTIVSD